MSKILKFSDLTTQPIDEKLLADFFKSQLKKNIKEWKAGSYELDNGSKFELKFDLFHFEPSQKKSPGIRLGIIGGKLGSGGYGSVNKIKRTIILNEDEIRLKKFNKKDGTQRAVKIQTHQSPRNPVERAHMEFAITKEISYLAIKTPTLIEKGIETTSYTVMKRMKGVDLEQLINEKKLTTAQKLELSKALLSALKLQVSDNGIIHRDIKPKNIIVDINNQISVKFIDFGISLRQNNLDGKCAGTIQFAPLEIIRNHRSFNKKFPDLTCIKSDVYSLGRLLAYLWGVDLNLYSKRFTHYEYGPEILLQGLFHNIHDLNDDQKSTIVKTLSGMLDNNLTLRFSIEQAIDIFNEDPKKLISIPLEHHESLPSIDDKLANDEYQQISSLTFVAPVDSVSCLTNDQQNRIKTVTEQLKSEAQSWLPYPNKELKQSKILGLSTLLDNSKAYNNASKLIQDIESDFPALKKGFFSSRTATLLDELKNSNHSPSANLN